MPRRGFILIAVTALVALACIGGFIASIWTSGDLSDRIFGTALVATMILVGPDEDNEIPVRSLQGWTVLVKGTFGLRPLTVGGRPVGFNTETQARAWLVGGERG